nr:ARF SAR superfamily domain containing protein [Haemonchus contortus]
MVRSKNELLHSIFYNQICSITGFNLETVEYRNVSFTVWDVGGQQRIRALWKYYFRDTQAIIFVVDSADVDRMEEARNEIHSLVADAELHDAVLLVFANKQDMPNAMSATEVSKALEMHSIMNREWYVQTSNAITGEGLVEGLEWLHSVVVNK